MAEEGHTVVLNVYDLSQGLARQLSSTFLGKAIEGIWHTGIVVYGHEYYFGGGIQCAPAGSTPYGTPIRAVELGVTHVPKDVFEMYLEEIRPRYTVETYSLLTHNCNNFSNEVAQFLVGATIPEHILNLPNEVMSSPMGSLMLPMMQNLETILKAGAVPQPPQFKPQSVAQPTQPVVSADMSKPAKSNSNSRIGQSNIRKSDDEFKSETESARPGEQKTSEISVPPVVKPANMPEKSTSGVVDPFGDARSKVQEEITKEFAAIMATGTLRASEAAALATRRVMQRYGHMNAAMPRC